MATNDAPTLNPTFEVAPDHYAKSMEVTSKAGNWLYVCKLCNTSISRNYKSRFNLTKHIKNKHGHLLKRYEEACKAVERRKKKRADPDVSEVEEVPKKKMSQPTLHRFESPGGRKLAQG